MQARSPLHATGTQRAGPLTLQQREGRPSARPPGATPVGVHSLLGEEAPDCCEAGEGRQDETKWMEIFAIFPRLDS